jgi:methionyl-tRNA synthetase
MEPVVPGSAEKLWRLLNLRGTVHDQTWDSASGLLIPEGHRIGVPEILFKKIEDDMIESELAKLGSAQNAQPHPEALPLITIEEFKKVDLRVAKVIQCEKVAKSEKLLKLQLEVGAEKRQIVAGIARQYAPEDLVGKSVVVVFNLQPTKLMGQESRGMLLAASDSDGKLVVISPSAEISSGSKVT